MGVKSTTTLSRSRALALFDELRAELYGAEFSLSNTDLGDALDRLHEEICHKKGLRCFDNYLVEDDHHYDERRKDD